MKVRVRATSETIVGDAEVQDQRHSAHMSVGAIGRRIRLVMEMEMTLHIIEFWKLKKLTLISIQICL